MALKSWKPYAKRGYVSSEIGLPRLPAGMRLMMARKKVVPIWKAQDIGLRLRR